MGITQTAAGPGAWPHSPGARPASATGGDTERQMSPAPAVDQARCSQQLLPVNTRITSQRFHPRRQRHRGGFGSSRPHSPRRPRESGRPPGARTQPSGPGGLRILQVPSLRTLPGGRAQGWGTCYHRCSVLRDFRIWMSHCHLGSLKSTESLGN